MSADSKSLNIKSLTKKIDEHDKYPQCQQQSISLSGIFKAAQVIQTTAGSTRERLGEVQSSE